MRNKTRLPNNRLVFLTLFLVGCCFVDIGAFPLISPTTSIANRRTASSLTTLFGTTTTATRTPAIKTTKKTTGTTTLSPQPDHADHTPVGSIKTTPTPTSTSSTSTSTTPLKRFDAWIDEKLSIADRVTVHHQHGVLQQSPTDWKIPRYSMQELQDMITDLHIINTNTITFSNQLSSMELLEYSLLCCHDGEMDGIGYRWDIGILHSSGCDTTNGSRMSLFGTLVFTSA